MSGHEFTAEELTARRVGVCRASYLAGEVDAAAAVADLMGEGIVPQGRARALLARPMSPERVWHYIAQEVSEADIAARAAAVNA